ncbi:hypothetical protein [Microbacterium paraoxydans]|uniref:hypothetical protein n=1 Tax=Microbacterium paraoxydans TaxID=199592 RepID=UPI001CFA84C3|nr:hypothetical protein [Microbacterium paraoxydans]
MDTRGHVNLVTARGTNASGLATPAARWAMLFVWLTGGARGFIEGVFDQDLALVAGGYLLALIGVFLLTDPTDAPLGRARGTTLLVFALGATTAATVTTAEAGDVWLLDFSTYLLALMFVRGNPALGLGGGAAQVAIVLAWAVATEQPGVGVLSMLTIPLLSYLLGILWRIALRWIVRAERAHRSERARRNREAAAADAATEQYRSELATISAAVRPALRDVLGGVDIDAPFRSRVAALEGEIRDRIRARSLQHPAIVAAVSAARARGVVVTLIAPLAEASAGVTDAAAEAVADTVASVDGGALVISVAAGDGTTVSIVRDGNLSDAITLRGAVHPLG